MAATIAAGVMTLLRVSTFPRRYKFLRVRFECSRTKQIVERRRRDLGAERFLRADAHGVFAAKE
jgi:hypothetical protein